MAVSGAQGREGADEGGKREAPFQGGGGDGNAGQKK